MKTTLKRVLSLLICLTMVVGMLPGFSLAVRAANDSDATVTIYFKNNEWTTANIYTWTADNSTQLTGGWPGTAMTDLGDGIWKYDVPAAAYNVIFNNGTEQTADLTIPTDGNNLYDYSTGTWSVYGATADTCTVSLTASPVLGGTVTGQGTYETNSAVTVTAAAKGDYSFVKWEKNGQTVSTNAHFTFTVTEDISLTAVFEVSEDAVPDIGSADEDALAIFRGSRTDLRDETVYTLIITQFYDGNTGNNVHCWDDGMAGNSDPTWRGDFEGLVEKLDYIKALGFTAVRLNSVVQNVSSYDYLGEHPFDMQDIDFRYEAGGFTYEDVIDACHARGMKVIQSVVLNHTSNFGEVHLRKLFDMDETADWSVTESLIPTEALLAKYPDYEKMTPADQYQARLDLLKESLNADGHYHHTTSDPYFWGTYLQQQAQIAGDCVDLNTEHPEVALYLAECCAWYAKMGVDAVYIVSAEFINRWTFNEGILPLLNGLLDKAGLELDIYYDISSRDRTTWNYNNPSLSVPFYSWMETEDAWKNKWSDDPAANIQTSIDHFHAHNDPSTMPTSDNALLNGITYHTPDYSKSNGMKAFDFTMLWNFGRAPDAFGAAKTADPYMNDATWNMVSVDNWDYGPDNMGGTRYSLGASGWMENLNLMFTFRGIPNILYGTEVEFAKNNPIDMGPNKPLSETGRAYFGDYLEGTVTATDFGAYEASGVVADTLDSQLSQHIRMLNELRKQIPALRKGQYTTDGQYVSGNMAFIRRYTNAAEGIDSLALVTISDRATFKNIPNGKYVDAVSGREENVTNGTLTISSLSSSRLAVYVCCAPGFTAIDAKMSAAESVLRFNVGGDTTAVAAQTTVNGTTTLPEPANVPEGHKFRGWIVNGEEYQPGDAVEISVNSMARAMVEHPYQAEFTWTEDLSAATCTLTCSSCDEGPKTENCTVTAVCENDVLTVTAVCRSFTDTLAISVQDGKLVLPEEFTADALIYAADYAADGKMNSVQVVDSTKAITRSGDKMQIFFLQKGSYAPILPCLKIGK